MVKALIDINVSTNRVLGIIKAEFGLRDKSEAIDKLAEEYNELVFEPKVKASYLKRLEKIRKSRIIKGGNVEDFKRRYNIK